MSFFSIISACMIPALSPPPAGRAGDFRELREEMVAGQLAGRDIRDPAVLRAMRAVPRHNFVPPSLADSAYDDRPLPIGRGQTISQPYIVALMTQLLQLSGGGRKVLEVGTGSGYQAAVLAEMGAKVFTVEIIPELAEGAARRLKESGYASVTVKTGDGYLGWREHAPFDGIIVTAAAPDIPPPLVEQLAEGGRLVIPVGSASFVQYLKVVTKRDGKVKTETVCPVRFVPLVRGKGSAD